MAPPAGRAAAGGIECVHRPATVDSGPVSSKQATVRISVNLRRSRVERGSPPSAAAAHRLRLSVCVGIHAGSVVVGQGGGMEAEVFGDAPNIAARVQAVATPDSVLMTGAVHD